MGPARISMPIRGVASQLSKSISTQNATISTIATSFTRSITTSAPFHASLSAVNSSIDAPASLITPLDQQLVNATIHSFPSLEPLRFQAYPANHLFLPTRRDILHRAIVYEGDNTRQGTASTKWRDEIRGSARKIRPQKGSGRARLGDKKSPMLKGGGVAFGPKPRDFGTELPRKVYDLAWRTALSYRFRKGELVIVDNAMELEIPSSRFLNSVFRTWGNRDDKPLMVTLDERPFLAKALNDLGKRGRTLTWEEVDVKDLLSMGRIVIERKALTNLLQSHQADLIHTSRVHGLVNEEDTTPFLGYREFEELVFTPRHQRTDMKPDLFTTLGIQKTYIAENQEKHAERMLKVSTKTGVTVADTPAEELRRRGNELRLEAWALGLDGLDMQKEAQHLLVQRITGLEHDDWEELWRMIVERNIEEILSLDGRKELLDAQDRYAELEAATHEFLAERESDKEEAARLRGIAAEWRRNVLGEDQGSLAEEIEEAFEEELIEAKNQPAERK